MTAKGTGGRDTGAAQELGAVRQEREPMKRKPRRRGVNAAAWFYGQPGFHGGVGPDRGQSDDQTQRATGQQTVMSGVSDEKPNDAVTTVTAGETALAEHDAACLSPVRCSDGLRLRIAAHQAKGLDAGPIQHNFKPHPLGRDFCTRSVLVSRAVYRKGLTLPADRRYCGNPAFMHVGKR